MTHAEEIQPIALATTPLHLGLGGVARVLPPIDGSMEWYEGYATSTQDDGVDGRLVSWHTFDDAWDSWEVHPNGSELVICTGGSILLRQELPTGIVRTVRLGPGQVAVNDPGVWHTADVDEHATVLFITAGLGTQHRAR